jgi:diguanylate cyclase (GGDEF)-like protein
MQDDKRLNTTQLDLLVNLRELQIRLLKFFFSILIAALLLAWFSESNIRHEVNSVDQVAYPIMIPLMTLSLALLQWWPQYYTLALIGTIGVICCYAFIFMHAIILGYVPLSDGYTFATFPQWFPLVYTLIFVFLKKRQALWVSLCIYASILTSILINTYQELDLSPLEQHFPYWLHIAMSHPIYIAVFLTVSTLQESFAIAKVKAKTADIDHLTHLINRRAASRLLRAALDSQQLGKQTCVGVILVDVDRFKSINDNYGHGIGDCILVEVAKLLKQDLPETDVAARWGGEEFLLVLLSADDSVEVTQRAEQLRARLAAYKHPKVGQVTASFGVSTTTTEGETLETLVARADAALYQAKEEGRNRVRGGVQAIVS